jgi:hypothetical protein
MRVEKVRVVHASRYRELEAGNAALREANASLVRWKGEIDSHLIAHRITFPDDYENSPKWAIAKLIEVSCTARNCSQDVEAVAARQRDMDSDERRAVNQLTREESGQP